MKFLLLIPMLLFKVFSIVAAQTETPFSLESYLLEKQIRTQSTKEGLHYTVERPGNGPAPVKGDYAVIRFMAMLLDSTEFDQSDITEPFIFQIGNKEVISGLEMGVMLMKKGSKYTFYLPASLGYGFTGIGNIVPPNSPLIYTVELTEILNFSQYDRYMRALEDKERREFQEKQIEQFDSDLKLLVSFARANEITGKRSGTGLSIAITKNGRGETANTGERLKVSYEGFLMTGQPIELPAGPRTYEFILGSGAVMEGWDEGFKSFNAGAEGWLLIPSKLAYGPLEIKEDNIFIPANSPLAFKVKLIEIIK